MAMTLLSRKADYALLILSHLEKNAEGGNARAIAEAFGLSRPFVANILKELGHKGFVTSTRGVKGGYVLQRASSTVTLAELMEAIEEGFNLTVCSEHPKETDSECCDLSTVCTVMGPLQEIHKRLMDVLRSVTLADVFHPVSSLSTLGLIREPVASTVTSA
jgi:Rrf2 family protein